MKSSKEYFRMCGWSIDDNNNSQDDFFIQQDNTTFYVKCMDSIAKTFMPSNKILDELREIARDVRKWNTSAIFVYNEHLPGISLEKTASSGVSLFTLDELVMVAEVNRFAKEVPPNIDSRLLEILSGNAHLCVAISEQCDALGDPQKAIEWLEHSIDRAYRISSGHIKLFDRLMALGEFDRASDVATRALRLDPKSLEFHRKMSALCISRGDGTDADEWNRRILKEEQRVDMVSPDSDVFGRILERQKSSRGPDSSGQDVSRAGQPSLHKSRLAAGIGALKRVLRGK